VAHVPVIRKQVMPKRPIDWLSCPIDCHQAVLITASYAAAKPIRTSQASMWTAGLRLHAQDEPISADAGAVRA
jgi:hypothetical protein